MSSVTLTQKGIQQTVKHYKAFFISEKPIFLSKTFNFILIICIANLAHGFGYDLSHPVVQVGQGIEFTYLLIFSFAL